MPRTKLTNVQGMEVLMDVGSSKYYPQRFGQALFNAVHTQYPDVANYYRGGMNDFFYWTDDVAVISTFLNIWMDKPDA